MDKELKPPMNNNSIFPAEQIQIAPIDLQALKVLHQHPVKRGTLMVQYKGVGYGSVPRDVWEKLIDMEWIKKGRRGKRLRLTGTGEYIMNHGTYPSTMKDSNTCNICLGAGGWDVEGFVPCWRCGGDGLWHE